MKQLVISKPSIAATQEVPVPVPTANQVCIRVRASGLCGTDLHIYRGGFAPAYPVVPGHEFAGEVVAVGSECRRIEIGARVAVEPNVPCNNCKNCLRGQHHYCEYMEVPGVNHPGGMAEYTLVREHGVFTIGDLDFSLGAFMEPLSCVIHGQDRLNISLGQRVLILGAGPIGLLHGIVASNNGAGIIDFVELNPKRAQKVLQYGWGRCFDNLGCASQNYDIVIDATGVSKLLSVVVSHLRPQGRLLLFGVPKEGSTLDLDHYYLFHQEIQIIGSFTSLKDSFRALDFIQQHQEKFASLISHKVSLDDLVKILSADLQLENPLKIMVMP